MGWSKNSKISIHRESSLVQVAEKLGHAGPGVTLATYRHLLLEERRAGALPLEELLGGVKHRA